MLKLLCTVGTVGTVGACGREVTGPVPIALITTDQAAYVTAPMGGGFYQFTAIVHFHNLSSAAMVLSTCGAASPLFVGFQPADSDGRPLVSLDSLPWLGLCSPNQPIVVDAGALRTDTVVVMTDQATGPGRLFVDAGQCPADLKQSGGDLIRCPTMLPDVERSSNLVPLVHSP
ncbi:MAG TPA: hypothetical protein VN613_07010 [Gemmatimonadaceae bacterium]|nr:hypothetical protein [Gemmatimonadaceae bacterium]